MLANGPAISSCLATRCVSLSLNITAGGVVRGKLADGPMAELRNLLITPSHFNGELAPNRDIVAVTLARSRQTVQVVPNRIRKAASVYEMLFI